MADQRIILITGASSGIGAALAREMGARGDKIILAARREIELRQAALAVEAAGGEALAVVCDVTKRDEVEQLRDAAIQRFGKIDVWVNNAGQGITRAVLELTDADIDAMVAINLKSALYGMQAVVPHFKERGSGHLINVSSVLSRVPFVSPRSIYSASKAALNLLTANLRMDLKEAYPAIRISLVMPGVVLTDFARNAMHGSPDWGPGSRPPNSQTAEEVAQVIAGLIDHPRDEAYTNPVAGGFVRKYFDEIKVYGDTVGGAV